MKTAIDSRRPLSFIRSDRRIWKFFVFFGLLSAALYAPGGTAEVIRLSLSDAYIQVSSFVALTLIIFYALEHVLKLDTDEFLKTHEKWQVPIAAFMGALPGCGGAIMVITQYVLGRISFGGMTAVLTATMGDAAFLLIAKAPMTALAVIGISVVAGTITGLIVDRIHGKDFMRSRSTSDWSHFRDKCGDVITYSRSVVAAWYLLLIPGIALGIGAAFQADTNMWFGTLAEMNLTGWIGFTGALFCFLIWAALPDKGFSMVNLMAHPACRTRVQTRSRVIFETSFVTTWVMVAFLLFNLVTFWGAFDLAALFKQVEIALPLMGILVGFIPGCGPQIIVTTLYLSGAIPFSAQLANAISNDGDALFPAIALAPRTAILATLYTAIPALVLGYGCYFLFEH